MAREDRAELGPVSDEGRGVTERRERLGLDIYELATEAGVNRDTVSAIEHGRGFRRSSLAAIERALSRLEVEAGMDAPPAAETAAPSEPHIIIVRLKNDVGEVAVEGPVDDLAELEAAARRLLRGLREDL